MGKEGRKGMVSILLGQAVTLPDRPRGPAKGKIGLLSRHLSLDFHKEDFAA